MCSHYLSLLFILYYTLRSWGCYRLPRASELVAGSACHVIDVVSDDSDNIYFNETQGNKIVSLVNKVIYEMEKIADIKFDWSGFESGTVRHICKNDLTNAWIIEAIANLNDHRCPKPIGKSQILEMHLSEKNYQ